MQGVAALCPQEGLFQTVVPPEHLGPDHAGRRAEHAVRQRDLGFRVVGGGDFGVCAMAMLASTSCPRGPRMWARLSRVPSG